MKANFPPQHLPTSANAVNQSERGFSLPAMPVLQSDDTIQKKANTDGSDNNNSPVAQLIRRDEIPQLAAVAKHITDSYPDYTIVGMGGSPAPIIAYLVSQGIAAYNIPLSIKGIGNRTQLSGEQQEELRKMMTGYIENIDSIKKIIVIDVSASGDSIANGQRLIQTAYPDIDVKGVAITENDDEPNNPLFEEKAKSGDVEQLRPKDIDSIDTSAFIGKLIGSGYKQYREVGVFQPHKGDTWDEYIHDELNIKKGDSFDSGSRSRYNELITYLNDVSKHTDEGIGMSGYEDNLGSMSSDHPKTVHKNSEDQKARDRIKRIQDKIEEIRDRQIQAEASKAPFNCCFLTTACVTWKGLADDCMELRILRHFRDQYVRKKENGEELIKNYYKYSPLVVDAINRSPDPGHIYNEIYSLVGYCIRRIEKEEYEKAFRIYVDLVLDLKDKFSPQITVNRTLL